MKTKILLTSDIHIGMKFSNWSQVKDELVKARFETLENIVTIANSEQVDLLVVAGDLFDRLNVSKKEITKVAGILGGFSRGPVLVLPGNHDYYLPDDDQLWRRFELSSADNLLVLKECKKFQLTDFSIPAVIWAAPCDSKHSSKNRLDWIKDAIRENQETSSLYDIGIAHGSLDGVSVDMKGKYFPMNREELRNIPMDLWLLGHSHSPWSDTGGEENKIFFAGTPEPDGFDCKHTGSVLVIEINNERTSFDGKGMIDFHPVETGQYRFLHLKEEIDSISDMELLSQKLLSDRFENSLIKLRPYGRVVRSERKKVMEMLKQIEERSFFTQVDYSGLGEKIVQEDIDARFARDSFPYQLLNNLASDKGDFEALQLAWSCMEEARK